MKSILLKTISYLALGGTIIPSLLVFFGDMNLTTNKRIMAVSMVVWFITAPFWINKNSEKEATE